MVKLAFILLTQWKEFIHKWKLNSVILISLIFSFVFIIIFCGKLVTIYDLKNLSALQHSENSFEIRSIYSTKDAARQLKEAVESLNADNISYVTNYITTFEKNGQLFTENFTTLEGNSHYFFKMRGFYRELGNQEVAISHYIAHKYHLKKNDTIRIDGREFKVAFIFESYQFEKRFVISSHANLDIVSKLASSYALIHFINADEKTLTNSLDTAIFNYQPLTTVNRSSDKSLTAYMVFIMVFSLVFILLCLTNCLLAFKGKMTNTMKNLSIKLLYGLGSKGILSIVLWENLLLSVVAFHIAYVGLFICRGYLPLFFTFRGDSLSYLLSLSFVILGIILYSYILMKRLSRFYIVDVLKGEVRM
ncbi:MULTISPECIES: ABC transporter permease [unclassified Granulicatella]|uniref:ABC transporter permease n=1 Tax=unclassified Granulicatella TaxID=2630493 RepID=UPI0010749AAF|nr:MULTISPECIES: ABC transporter permease [unclassified Granulicatella]MBF0780956.1 ABC transporter permease [Granulicatella sp. 19428wC4_WM01]TFU92976.1 hypothetical protein E4T68_07550 [Granulicatella sp. WM01]